MTLSPDRPGAVREGLDTEALSSWLERSLGWEGALLVEQYPSGYSNLTYRLVVDGQDVVLRRAPPGANIRGGHDMGREFRLLSALYGRVPVAEPILFEDSTEVLGSPFYLMHRVEGAILRSTMAVDERPDAEVMAAVSETFLDQLATLHALDPEALDLGDLGHPQGYVGRQLTGWRRRYGKARTDEIPELDRAFDWLEENQPRESGVALIHNDYKYDNLLLDLEDLGRVRAILDWEMATVADPLMDLGSSLGYWVEEGDSPALRAVALSPTWWPGNPSRHELVERYCLATGRELSNPVFYYCYGLVKLAGIAQQIYCRWCRGDTEDPRFAGLIHTVRACGETAIRAIERRRLSGLS